MAPLTRCYHPRMIDRTEPVRPTLTVPDYLAALASGEGTPGGGSASAITGAMGIALGAMVSRLSRKHAEGDAGDRLDAHITTADRLRLRLEKLADLDELAFRAYLDAVALPKQTDDEKATRRGALHDALIGAAAVPLEVAELCVQALAALATITADSTKHTRSDIDTGCALLAAAGRGALVNARVNVDLLKDESAKTELTSAATNLERRLVDGIEAVHQARADVENS